MEVKEFMFNHLYAYIYKPEGEVKGIIQVVHGMSEHMGRYKEFAELLSGYGMMVTGFDLRGHGRNNESDIASMHIDGWKKSLDDIHQYYVYMSSIYPDIPYYMLGFSLGSFLLREYLNTYKYNLNGAVIAGTGYQPKFILDLMLKIVDYEIRKAGFDYSTPLIQKLSFDTYNKHFKPCNSDFDWLCSDYREVDRYMNDRYCKKVISSGLFYQLLSSMRYTGKSESMNNYNKAMPLLFVSGEDDPVGNFSKGIRKIIQIYKDNRFKSIDYILYEGGRHDIIHECDSGIRDQFVDDLIKWINRNT